MYWIRQISFLIGLGAIVFAGFSFMQAKKREKEAYQTIQSMIDLDAPSNIPRTDKLALQKRVFNVSNTQKKSGAQVNRHDASFGNWTTRCSFTRSQSDNFGECIVVPYNGNTSEMSMMNLSYNSLARVSYRGRREGRIDLVTPLREKGSDIAYKCSDVVSKGPENKSENRIFIKTEAERFINRMGRSDCTIEFTRRGEEEATIYRFLSHGFSQANMYAKQYALNPKLVQ